MQDRRVKQIMAYLEGKAAGKFTGGVKMGFENGHAVSFSESSNADFRTTPELAEDFILEDQLWKALARGYYGTLYFVFRKGEVTNFYYNRTWQGRALEEFLSPAPLPCGAGARTKAEAQ
jgi:hypothetical protein